MNGWVMAGGMDGLIDGWFRLKYAWFHEMISR